MAKAKRRPDRRSKPKQRKKAVSRSSRESEPDLLHQIGAALSDDDPLPLLGLASSMLALVDPRGRGPFARPGDELGRNELLESFLGVPLPETSALLTALAGLSGDDVLRRRVHQEVAARAHPLPDWLSGMARSTAAERAVEAVHVLGDGENLLVSATLPGGHPLTTAVFVDHNMGTMVVDAFVVSGTLDDVHERVLAASADDPDMLVRPLTPADARARISAAAQLSSISFPPVETETWPACRALVEWMVGLLPAGGAGYEQPEWSDAALDDLARRFLGSPFAADVDDPADLLSTLLRFGRDYTPGDPMRMSPESVELLLLDRIPRKVVADADDLTAVPDLLRAFVRFCHDERGVRAELTERTVAAIDAMELDYQRLIRSDRPQGPAALLAGMGIVDDEPPDDISDIMLHALGRAVGGGQALDALTDEPLPDEPFAWAAAPSDVHGRVGEVLDLVDRCCADLLDVEYRTACRRLLADVAAADPEIFRRRGRADTAAGAVCWLVGRSNSLFDHVPATPKLAVKHLAEYLGVAGASMSQRSESLLRAIGVDPHGSKELGSPRYLTGSRRARLIADRDRYRAMAGSSS